MIQYPDNWNDTTKRRGKLKKIFGTGKTFSGALLIALDAVLRYLEITPAGVADMIGASGLSLIAWGIGHKIERLKPE